ncbi:hypothetical protein AB1Y20_008869 [Prymnesium parvum]|uniref:Uncharacterized protein n=1 Tax=Prymnesium parvum TaxID=97485 RepID=A0AB34ISP3_PRYPA
MGGALLLSFSLSFSLASAHARALRDASRAFPCGDLTIKSWPGGFTVDIAPRSWEEKQQLHLLFTARVSLAKNWGAQLVGAMDQYQQTTAVHFELGAFAPLSVGMQGTGELGEHPEDVVSLTCGELTSPRASAAAAPKSAASPPPPPSPLEAAGTSSSPPPLPLPSSSSPSPSSASSSPSPSPSPSSAPSSPPSPSSSPSPSPSPPQPPPLGSLSTTSPSPPAASLASLASLASTPSSTSPAAASAASATPQLQQAGFGSLPVMVLLTVGCAAAFGALGGLLLYHRTKKRQDALEMEECSDEEEEAGDADYK